VCGEAEDAHGALAVLPKCDVDIALVDLSLKDMDGLDLIRRLRAVRPDLPVLVLSMHDESLYAERALRAGAKGYIMKQEAIDRVIEAIRHVLEGEVVVSSLVSTRILSRVVDGSTPGPATPLDCLSNRELEIFQLIGEGLSTRRIAERLNISVKTVETHREHLKGKLNVDDGTALLKLALLWTQSKA
jgi:DNA-binding NarL/FixJ family response regulator